MRPCDADASALLCPGVWLYDRHERGDHVPKEAARRRPGRLELGGSDLELVARGFGVAIPFEPFSAKRAPLPLPRPRALAPPSERLEAAPADMGRRREEGASAAERGRVAVSDTPHGGCMPLDVPGSGSLAKRSGSYRGGDGGGGAPSRSLPLAPPPLAPPAAPPCFCAE